jgi:hypothetical protein
MSQTQIDAFIKEVIDHKNKQITDEVFLLIQNDRKFMREYLRLVETDKLNVVNMRIGKQIKDAYKLTNTKTRNSKPTSMLIESFQDLE